MFHLDEIQKFIFAKRVIEGSAKLFIEYENKATTWNTLKAELKAEFGSSLNSALVHQQLAMRKKKNTETSTEYLYEMLSIGSSGNVDHAAIITYTIDGLPGSPATKIFYVRSQNDQRFQAETSNIDLIQPKFTPQQSNKNTKSNEQQEKSKEKSKIQGTSRCKNCGSKLHNAESCPNKENWFSTLHQLINARPPSVPHDVPLMFSLQR